MTFRTILLAADMAPEGAFAIDYAFALAEKLHATLHVLHASPSAGPEEGVRAREKLQAALARHRDSPSLGKSLVSNSDPITAIMRATAELSVDLVIAGSNDRRGAQRVLVGSFAEGVLRETHVPLLIVKSPKATVSRSERASPEPLLYLGRIRGGR